MFMGVWEGCLHLGDLQGLFAFLGVLGGLGGGGANQMAGVLC